MSEAFLALPLVAIVIVAILWVALKSRTDRLPPGYIRKNSKREAQFFERAASFSFIAFDKQVEKEMEGFLSYQSLAIMGTTPAKAGVISADALLEEASRSDDPDYQYMAIAAGEGWTWLVGTLTLQGEEKALLSFAREEKCRAIAVTWERVSETAMLSVAEPGGVFRSAHFEAGELMASQGEIPSALQNSPNESGLLTALKPLGLSREVLEKSLDMTLLRLHFVK